MLRFLVMECAIKILFYLCEIEAIADKMDGYVD